MKVVGYLVVFVSGIIACYLFLSLGVVDVIDGLPGTEKEPLLSLPTYLNFVSVMLTSVTVVLAGLAIGIGVIAAYTIRDIKDDARRSAENIAQELVSKALSKEKIELLISKVAFGDIFGGIENESENKLDANDEDERDKDQR